MEDILKDIVRQTYHRFIPPDVEIVERNGHVFFVHPTRRFDPVFTPIGLAAGASTATAASTGAMILAGGAMIGGTVAGMQSTRQQGKDAEKIAKARAAVELQNAEAAKTASIEKAKIRKEQGWRFLEQQKSGAAAGNIRINVGAPLVIEAETRSYIARDIGYILETGRAEENYYRSSAAIELATGKAARKQARRTAWSQGLMGFGSVAMMGAQSGLFNRPPALSTSGGANLYGAGGAGFAPSMRTGMGF